VFDLAKKIWLVKPVFEEKVDFMYGASMEQIIYTTKKNGKHFCVDPLTAQALGEGFDELTSMHSFGYSLDPNGDKFLARNGGSVEKSKAKFVYGGKYGIVDHKNRILHPLTADEVFPLGYTNNSEEWTSVIGFLCSTGGTVHEYINDFQDSVYYEDFDQAGNAILTRTVSPPSYDKKIIGGKFGIMGPDGREIYPQVYDDIRVTFVVGEGRQFTRRSYRDSVRRYYSPALVYLLNTTASPMTL
jgi:hypothetical protein